MKLIWHLFLFNIKFNRMRLIFLSLVSVGIVLGCSYFYSDTSERGGTIIQYSLYVMFMIFTMRMNAKGNSSLAVKHLLAIPMNNRQIVFYQSLADITFYFPISFVLLYGFHLVQPDYHILMVGTIFHLALIVANIISFNKKIDLGRMQHTKASFKNSFVYIKKYLDTVIQIAIMVMIITIITVAFSSNIILQEYSFFILVVVSLFVVFSRTVKMLQDETQSYFLIHRDVKTVLMKLALVGIPFTVMSYVLNQVDQKQILRQVAAQAKGVDYVENITDKVSDFSVKVDDQKLFMDISNHNHKGVDLYLLSHKTLPVDQDVLGNYLPHLAAMADNVKVLELLYKQDPELLNMVGKHKKTSPLQTALKKCHLESAEFLIEHGANINHQNIDGESPVLTAAMHRCHGGVLLLSAKGAKLDLKNKNGKQLLDYIQGTGLDYIIEQKYHRTIASEEETEDAVPKETTQL